MQALSFLIGVVAVAIAAWVFFDATDRGKKAPWLWSVATLVLLPTFIGAAILLAVYAGQRNTGRRTEVAPGPALRLYLVVTSFSSLVLMVAGAATAMAAALAYGASDHLSSNDFRDLSASALSAFIVGAVLWWPHRSFTSKRLAGLADDAEFRALFHLRRTEDLTITFVLGAIAAGNGLAVLGGAMSALFQATQSDKAVWLPELGVFLATGCAAVYHGLHYRRSKDSPLDMRYRGIPAPKLVEPSPAARGAYPPPVVAVPTLRAAPPPPTIALPPTIAPPSTVPPSTVPPSTLPPSTGPPSPVTAQPTFCGRCGTRAVPGDAFCRSCGTAVRHPGDEAPHHPAVAG